MVKKLLEMNFKENCLGIHYLADAVQAKKDDIKKPYTVIYMEVGKKYGTSYTATERAIRYCIRGSKNKFNNKQVSEVISALAILL